MLRLSSSTPLLASAPATIPRPPALAHHVTFSAADGHDLDVTDISHAIAATSGTIAALLCATASSVHVFIAQDMAIGGFYLYARLAPDGSSWQTQEPTVPYPLESSGTHADELSEDIEEKTEGGAGLSRARRIYIYIAMENIAKQKRWPTRACLTTESTPDNAPLQHHRPQASAGGPVSISPTPASTTQK